MFVQVTLNGRESTIEKGKFSYYPDIRILDIKTNNGPVSGGTVSHISCIGFSHPNVCNPKVKYGALEVTPELAGSFYKVVSPKVALPGAVTLFPSGNGQNYGPDLTLHYRD